MNTHKIELDNFRRVEERDLEPNELFYCIDKLRQNEIIDEIQWMRLVKTLNYKYQSHEMTGEK